MKADTLRMPAAAASPTTVPAGVSWEQVAGAYGAARSQREAGPIDKALTLVASYLVMQPQDGRALAYQGSLLTMRARASILPWKKLSMLQDGIGRMEHGVALVLNDPNLVGTPIEIEVRAVRGTTSARIPRLFGRGASARADLRAVIDNPLFVHMRPQTQANALAWLAVLHERDGNPGTARDLLKRARGADVQTANTVWGDDQ